MMLSSMTTGQFLLKSLIASFSLEKGVRRQLGPTPARRFRRFQHCMTAHPDTNFPTRSEILPYPGMHDVKPNI